MLLAISPWVLPSFLPFLSQYIKNIEILGTKLNLLENKVENESQRIDDLFFLSIGNKLLKHMQKLNYPNGYGNVFVGSALPRELEYLENLGYIEFKAPLKGLDDFLKQCEGRRFNNLLDYIQLTETGQLFLKLREQSEVKRNKN